MNNSKQSIVLVDDHVLLRNGLASLINSSSEYQVLFEADNGKRFIEQLKPEKLPDIVLLDINMPEMDGYETGAWIRNNYPEIRFLALSMYDNDNAIIRMLRCGARGYVLKDIEPIELMAALHAVMNKGYYYSEMITGKLIHSISNIGENGQNINSMLSLNDREKNFLKLVCTEMSYKEIAEHMFLSPRTIDGYRDNLFEKLNIKSRVGLAMYAIKSGLVNL